MHSAFKYALCMPALQIRDLPEDVHRVLKSRAALAGMSLSEYASAELRRSVERPTRQDVLERIAARRVARPRVKPATAVRAERDR